jgi:hypothetical protein
MIKDQPVRNPGIMQDHLFDLSLTWLKKLVDKNTQKEVHLNGNGESLLDPQFFERARRVKAIMGNRLVNVCTNGVNFTEDMAYKLRDVGINVDLSIHAPAKIRKALKWYKKAGLKGTINPGVITYPHNWAGQLESEHCVDIDNIKIRCDPLIEGRGYISSEGWVSPCCYDYRLLGVFGHVADTDLLEKPIYDYELCRTCHQVIPPDVINKMYDRISYTEDHGKHKSAVY